MLNKLYGVIVPLVTPVRDDGTIDLISYGQIAEYCAAGGADALFLMGTAGEGCGIDESEKLRAIEYIAEHFRDRITLIGGVLEPTTVRAISYIKKVEQLGISRFAVTPCYYGDLTMEDVYNHFRLISQSLSDSSILYLYNIPGTTHISISLETMKRIKALGNVKGIKNSAVDFHQFLMILEELQDDSFSVFQGYEELGCAGFSCGADGIVPCDANVYPAFFRKMADLAMAKDHAALRKMDPVARKVLKIQNFSPYWLSSLKAALDIIGVAKCGVTMPYTDATEAERDALKGYMEELDKEVKQWQ